MSIWGTLATVGAGVGATLASGGNVALGVAAAGAVSGSVGGGGGACVPPNVGDVQELLRVIPDSVRQAWTSLDTGKRAFTAAINANDAGRIVAMVADSSCNPAHPVVQRLYELLQLNPGTSNTTAPVVPVTASGGGGGVLGGVTAGVQDFFTGIVKGAAAGATGAAQSGGSASQQSATGAGVGGFVATNWPLILLLLVGAVLIVPPLLRRGGG